MFVVAQNLMYPLSCHILFQGHHLLGRAKTVRARASLLKSKSICGPSIRLVLDGIIIQCDDVIICNNTWWNTAPEAGDWNSAPYREFLQLKTVILQSNERELERVLFFVSFCNEFKLKRTRSNGYTTREDEIDYSFGRACMYASRLYTSCMYQLEILKKASSPDVFSKRMIATSMMQVMRLCMITRTSLMSCIPTILASPTLDCIDILFVKFNQHLIDLSEITTRMNYISRTL